MRKSQISNLKSQNVENKEKQKQGLVITYYGNGKGKTTAALGLALRASGYNKKIVIIQFIKGNWSTGEEKAVQGLENIKLIKSGAGFIGILNDKKPMNDHYRAAQEGLALSKKSQSKCEILILDEILGALQGGLIQEKDVLELIERKPPNLTLILTGRPKINSVLEKSDLVTEMRKIKHPYDGGVQAIEGIDY